MAIKPAEYRLSPKAREDVEAVWLYSLQTWGADQADHYIDDLMHSFQLLVDNPKLGRNSDNIRAGYCRYPIMQHTIYYRKANYGIEIIRILHNRMLVSRHL